MVVALLVMLVVLGGCAEHPLHVIYTVPLFDPCDPQSGDGHPDQLKGQSFNTPDTGCI